LHKAKLGEATGLGTTMDDAGSAAGVKKPFWHKLLGSDNPNPVKMPYSPAPKLPLLERGGIPDSQTSALVARG
jgi:hypothetical protein